MIKIDMEMPSGCYVCPIKKHYITDNPTKWKYRCGITKSIFNSNLKGIMKNCPLIEVKE